MKEVEVLERDETGRPMVVRYRAGAFGRSTRYVLVYDYSKAPEELSWTQREGDLTNQPRWSLISSRRRAEGTTEVSYELAVELKVPIPGFVRRRAEGHILHAAVRDSESSRRIRRV